MNNIKCVETWREDSYNMATCFFVIWHCWRMSSSCFSYPAADFVLFLLQVFLKRQNWTAVLLCSFRMEGKGLCGACRSKIGLSKARPVPLSPSCMHNVGNGSWLASNKVPSESCVASSTDDVRDSSLCNTSQKSSKTLKALVHQISSTQF